LNAAQLRSHWKAIDRWNAAGGGRGGGGRGLTVLKSVELDILENAKLDLPDDVLAQADYVVATIHYGLNQTERQLTERLLVAVEHRWVDAIGHPTGRVVNRREPYPLDFDRVAGAAAAAGCLLELNGSERMDLPDTMAAAAKAAGARFVLSTDAHHPSHLGYMRYAVDLARRAGLEARDIVNTLGLDEFRKALKRAKR
ncbi:MAG: DNA polymerase/3'-5' exonuclease PolX, partial [Gemmatimonadales bacterium]